MHYIKMSKQVELPALAAAPELFLKKGVMHKDTETCDP